MGIANKAPVCFRSDSMEHPMHLYTNPIIRDACRTTVSPHVVVPVRVSCATVCAA